MKRSEAMIMDDWRNKLRSIGIGINGGGDVFDIIKRAIMVAASDHPTEFLINRDEIAQTLFSSHHHQENNIGCENKMKDDDVNNHGIIYDGDLVHENKMVVTTDDDEVLRIKQILDHAKLHESESAAVYESLSTLEEMGGMSFKTLEATMIGRSVKGFQKHASMEIRQIARRLINKWRCVVDEWIEASEKTSSCVVQQEEVEKKESKAAEKQMVMKKESEAAEKQMVMKKESNVVESRITKGDIISEKAEVEEEKKEAKVAEKQMVMKKESSNVIKLRIISEKAKVDDDDHNISGSQQRRSDIITNIEKKVAESKRKLHQRYEEAESAKRQRKIQVIEPYQLIKKQKQDLILSKTKCQNTRIKI